MAKKDGSKARSRADRFEFEQTMSADEVAGYLEGLARDLRAGAVVIAGGSDGFRAAVSSDVELEVEARSGKRKSRVELTLAFRSEKPAEDEQPTGSDGSSPEEAQPEATIPDEMSF